VGKKSAVPLPEVRARTRLNIVLICHYGRAGYNVLRSLSYIGARVFVIRDERAISMRYSLRATALYNVPHLDQADPEHIATLINQLHLRHGIDSVIGADVESQSLILRMRDRLKCPIFPIASDETLTLLNNKWTFYQLCRRLDVPVPKSLLWDNTAPLDANVIGQELGWPVIVKPIAGYGQRGIMMLKDRDDFTIRFVKSALSQQLMIVQEYLDGPDWALGVFARNGKIEHWIAWICPGQMDTGYGVGRFLATEFIARYDLEALGERLIAATNFSGVANFDLRGNTRSGEVCMLECNPRCFNRMLATRANGLDFILPGLPGSNLQPRTLEHAFFYPWQELLTPRGIKRLLHGKWPLLPLVRDVRDMVADPLVPVMRKLLHEDARD
jgi:predicted ATP-grasp superfamily ATP-dependent carboligase